MICPHCAFPNKPGDIECSKCHRLLSEPSIDSHVSGPPTQPPVKTREPKAIQKPAALDMSKIIEQIKQDIESDKLRSAFLTCQSVLIDHFENLSKESLVVLYQQMSSISQLQEKPERAKKYAKKAGDLQNATTPSPSKPKMLTKKPLPPENDSQTIKEADEASGAPPPPGAEEIPPQGNLIYVAGLWTRIGALCIDFLLVLFIVVCMSILTSLLIGEPISESAQFFLQTTSSTIATFFTFGLLLITYLTIFSRFGGQSAGKMILGLKVVGLNGRSISTTQALLRAGGMVVAALPGLAGFWWCGFDLCRRGWHDHIGKTFVVDIRRQTKEIEQAQLNREQISS
jgi:uncharacterized RDD family membrane protein YckC